MRFVRALCVAWIGLTEGGRARAEAPAAPPSAATSDHSLTVATNFPALWTNAYSIAGSLSVNLSARHAIRANVASYAYNDLLGGTLAALAGGDGADIRGRTTDLALSWVFYPRRLWDGFLLEAGALRRAREVTTGPDEDTALATDRRTTVHAGRMMVGWSWLVSPYLFVAAAAGVSVGWESGVEDRTDARDRMTSTRIARQDVTGEGYLRFGVVIDL